jgi:hypothetical protein
MSAEGEKRMSTTRIFAISCAGLILAFAIGIGARGARGQGVSFRVIGPSTVVVGENVYVLDTSNQPFGWKALPYGGFTLPPVPASTLVNYASGVAAITDTGEGWGKVGGTWTDLGPVPSLVPTTKESWGQLKAKYAR